MVQEQLRAGLRVQHTAGTINILLSLNMMTQGTTGAAHHRLGVRPTVHMEWRPLPSLQWVPAGRSEGPMPAMVTWAGSGCAREVLVRVAELAQQARGDQEARTKQSRGNHEAVQLTRVGLKPDMRPRTRHTALGQVHGTRHSGRYTAHGTRAGMRPPHSAHGTRAGMRPPQPLRIRGLPP